jgi:hypothetical protein
MVVAKRNPARPGADAGFAGVGSRRLFGRTRVGRLAATLATPGEVAQLVEHTAENRGVAGSIPALAISRSKSGFGCRRSHDDFERIAFNPGVC